MPLTHWHSEWVFSLILTLSRHNLLDLGASVGCAGQKGSWDRPEGSQALQHGGIYLGTIRNGPEPWNSGKNPNSPEVGVMGEPCVWVSPVEILTSPQPEFPKVPSWAYILRDIFETISYQEELGEISVQSYLCGSSAWTSLHKWHGEAALTWRITREA